MWSLEEISTDFKAADSTMKQLGDVFKAFQIHSSTDVCVSDQWANLQHSFSLIMDSLHSRINALGSIVKTVDDRQKGLELKERELVIIEKSICDRELALNDAIKSIESKNKELELKQKELGSTKKLIENRLEMVDKFISDSTKEIQLRREELDEFEKSLNDRYVDINSAEKKLMDDSVDEAVVKSDKLCHELEGDASLRFHLTMDGKTFQIFLNDRFGEHEFMGNEVYRALKLSNDPAKLVLDAIGGFFPPHLRKDNLEYEASVVRSTCVLILEQLLKMKPPIKKLVRDEARELAFKWKERMWPLDGDPNLVVLGFLLLVATYDLASNFDQFLLINLIRLVNQHPQALELHRHLGLIKWNHHASSDASKFTHEEPQVEALPVSDGVIPSCPVPVDKVTVLCANMDVKGLRKYLLDHARTDVLRERVSKALQSARDPARLVFNVVEGFYASGLGKEQGDDNKTGCILLLDLLMELSPDIPSCMKEQAMKFAYYWEDRCVKDCRTPLHVFGFLQFLAAYRLASCFDADLLLSLFGSIFSEKEVGQVEQKRRLCNALGLTDKIPDLIQILIDKNKLLRAVRCICSFDLVDKFQPVPLLKAHLANVKKTAKMRGRHRSDKIIAKIAAADSELTALRGVVRCILDYELHNEFSPTNLTRRIEMLEKEKKLRKNIVPDKMDMKMCAADEGKKQSFMPLNLDRTSSGSAESSNPLPNSRGYRKRLASRATQQQQSLEKRPKTAVMSNKEVAPCVHSTEPPSQVPQYTKFKPQQIIVSPANVAGPSMGITGCAAHNVGVGQFGTIPTATSLTDARTAPSSSTVPSYPRTAPSASY